MMPWQMGRDLIRVREAELSRRARSAARDEPAGKTTVDDLPRARAWMPRLWPLARLARLARR